ncbi:tautomerase family protein [Allosphingosinicella deserti]|uniref:4-oxalocrotonate tautomerase n=1 Tax=Allosphingosinicella deserti TaxID=2116704 RepID=A0A2P7QZR5_9SPHN|nr:4-oxalocrotonate tautomerase family protein [Sphingomonas deserti]PSJ43457.1 4-oxalocrotonate tautomerase [Sphingomonas deserti]
MPIITVQVTKEGTELGIDHVTAEQKAAIYEGMSKVLYDVLGKPPEWTWVIFQEVEMEDWGWGGLPVLEYRRRMAESRNAQANEEG